MRKARFNGDYLIVDLTMDEFEDRPQWRSIAMIEKNTQKGQNRRIFYPLFGKKEGLTALKDKAEVHSYRYKPYVDIEWLIKYQSEQNEMQEVSLLLSVIEHLNIIADL